MFPNRTLNGVGRFNFSLNGSYNFDANLDILFTPDPILIALYLPTIVISLVTNLLLIIVALIENYTKNVTNMFLVNLSAADILVTTICMPIQLSKAFTLVWFYGEIICKTTNYMQGVAVAASIFTIAVMSVDRWLSITPQPRLRPATRKRAMILITVLWIVAMLIFIPVFEATTVETETVPVVVKDTSDMDILSREIHFCTEVWSGPEAKKRFGIFSFTLVYAIPGTVTILCYACMGRTLCSQRPPFDFDDGNAGMQQGLRLIRERRRIAWILLLLAMFFALCWMPYNIMQLMLDLNEVGPGKLSNTLPYALFVGHLNSAINPVVYFLMTRNFRRSAKQLLCQRSICRHAQRYTQCAPKPEPSSSDYEHYHGTHKRCYLQMHTFRNNTANGQVHAHAHPSEPQAHSSRGATDASQLRLTRRSAPLHTLSVQMLERHRHIEQE